MKRIILFRTDLLPTSETFIREQILALTQWSPILAGYRKVKDGLDLTGINVRIIPGLSAGSWSLLWLRLCQWLGIAHAPTVQALREIDASLVHVHFGTDAVDMWPNVRKLGLPMLVTLHGYDVNIYREWWEEGHGGIRRRRYPRQLLKLAEEANVRFIAVSKAIQERAVQIGIPAGKITVCYLGIDTKKFHPGETLIVNRPKRILFVGRLVEKKGASYLIRAFAQIRTHIHDAELTIIGDGPERNALEHLAESLKIYVHFTGTLDSEQVKAHMLHARLLSLPSVTAENGDAEGLPIVILESQACGLPVITSAKGGRDEGIEDGVTGLAHPEAALGILTAKLSLLLTNDTLIKKLSVDARLRATRDFDISTLTAKLERIYHEHMARQI